MLTFLFRYGIEPALTPRLITRVPLFLVHVDRTCDGNRVLFNVLTGIGGTFIRVCLFTYPSSEGETCTFTPVKMEPFYFVL